MFLVRRQLRANCTAPPPCSTKRPAKTSHMHRADHDLNLLRHPNALHMYSDASVRRSVKGGCRIGIGISVPGMMLRTGYHLSGPPDINRAEMAGVLVALTIAPRD